MQRSCRAKSRPAILRVLHFPDLKAKISVSGSCRLVSFEAAITGRAGSVTDGVASKTTTIAKTCRQRRIVRLDGEDIRSVNYFSVNRIAS